MNNPIYENAKAIYAAYGIDTDSAIEKALSTPISLHCWQGDDVKGFEGARALDGGIQATGNYPGAARNPEELMADLDKALSLMPGAMRINLHANYAIFNDNNRADRDALLPEHFEKWVEFAIERGLGLDFNPTFFSHPMVKDGLTLSSPDDEVRAFWVRHGIASLRIGEYFAKRTGKKCLINFWMPDGLKEIPADRYSPRARMADSLDKILAAGYDKELVDISLESKVFGIGLESYTVGSAEFCLAYSASRGLVPLMDNGHYHPTEQVADKIPSMLLFNDKIALHVTRCVRWDSDHVVRYDDETREILREVVRCGGVDKTYIALDYFDASINRVAAWITGLRAARKALLNALLTPEALLADYQNKADYTSLLVISEEIKTAPFGAVWEELCARAEMPAGAAWFEEIKKYENEVLSARN
ncbi:MAG: L-rhamnose isomerase [Clostridia bacterium]|nr:L-rhamnose isomerase [Clostridia bacterium]